MAGPGSGGRGLILAIVVAVSLAVSLAIAGLVLPLWLTFAGGKSYDFPRVEVDATVRPDGSLDLVERRTFDFDGDFSFAFFTIAWPPERIEGLTVTEGGMPVTVREEPSPGGFRARWEFDAEDEQRTFEISYTARCAVDVYRDTAHLYWQFIGTGWEVPTESALVRVRFPGRAVGAGPALRPTEECPAAAPPPAALDTRPMAEGDVLAWAHGPLQGEVRIPEPDLVVLEVADVPEFTFVEGSIVFPKDAVPVAFERPVGQRATILGEERRLAQEANVLRRAFLAEERRRQEDRRVVWWLLFGIPAAMVVLLVISKVRDRVPGVPRALQDPPEDLHPLVVAELMSSFRGVLHPSLAYRTELLHLVGEGNIEMIPEGKATDPDDLTIRLRDRPQDGVDREFVDALFGSEDGTRELSLDEMGKSQARGKRFQKWWMGLLKQGRSLRVATGRWEGKLTALLGIGGAAYGFWVAGGRLGPFSLWLVLVSVASMIAVLIPMDRRVRPEFRERVAKWKAFRRFLRRFSSLPDAPAMAVVVWERYLAYAVALGVADEVEKQVKALVPQEELPAPWADGPSGVQGLTWFHHVAHSAGAPVVYSSSSGSGSSGGGSFSSGGGGGGGFSGGGGGGGGGTGGGAG